jgi:hypothetical protein
MMIVYSNTIFQNVKTGQNVYNTRRLTGLALHVAPI